MDNIEGWSAPLILAIVFSLHLLLRLGTSFFAPKKVVPPEELQLMKEISALYQQAKALSTPSTFAKSAKLERMAIAKEKELAQWRKNAASHLSTRQRASLLATSPTLLKVSVYILITLWFWNTTMTSLPPLLVRPFDKALSWPSKFEGGSTLVKVGVLPWLVLTTRVSTYFVDTLFGKQKTART